MRLKGMDRYFHQRDLNRQHRQKMNEIAQQCKAGDYSSLHLLERDRGVTAILSRNGLRPADLARWKEAARVQARQNGKLLHELYEDADRCLFCDLPQDQWFTGTEECTSHKAVLELFEPETPLEVITEVCNRWTMRCGFDQDRLIRQVQTKTYDRLEQYLGATPLAELHVPTHTNCGHHLTTEEAREIVKIIRAEIDS